MATFFSLYFSKTDGKRDAHHHPISNISDGSTSNVSFISMCGDNTRSLVIANSCSFWKKRVCVLGSWQTTNKERELERIKSENLGIKNFFISFSFFLFFFYLFFLFFFLPSFFFSSLRHSIKRTSAVVKLTLAFQLLQFSIVIISGSRHEKSGLCSPFVHD